MIFADSVKRTYQLSHIFCVKYLNIVASLEYWGKLKRTLYFFSIRAHCLALLTYIMLCYYVIGLKLVFR